MSMCMLTPAIQDCLCISPRHGWSWMDGWTVRSCMVLQCRRRVSLLPAGVRIAGGPVRSSASPTHCVCSGEECFAGSYCTRYGPSGSGVACIYGSAWTSKGMMYCVLTLPGKAAHGAWPGHGCSAIPRRIRSSNSTRPPTALRVRYRRRVPVDGRATAHTKRMPPIPRRTDRIAHRPSTSQQPRSRPVEVSPPADQKARYRARPPDLARWRSTGRSVQRPTAIRCAVARLGLPVAGGPGKCAGGVGYLELSRAIHRARDRRDGAMLLWAGPRRAAQLFRVQSWRHHHRAPSIPSPLPCRPLRAASTRPRLHPFPMAEGRGREAVP